MRFRIDVSFVTLAVMFLSLSEDCAAQGYVVTTKGDTVKGVVKILSMGPDKKVQVIDGEKKKKIVPLLQLRSFQVDNEIYHPVKGPAGYTFMKIEKEGYLSLYRFQQPNQSNYDGYFLQKKDGTSLEVPNLNFKKGMTRFLADCGGTAAKIDNGTFTRRDLQVIVDDYNACVSGRTVAGPKESPVVTEVPQKQAGAWSILREKVTALPDFQGKTDAIDMIAEVEAKLSRGEKVQNFLLEGVKNSLKNSGLTAELDAALQETK